jgi:hypothetical protein
MDPPHADAPDLDSATAKQAALEAYHSALSAAVEDGYEEWF